MIVVKKRTKIPIQPENTLKGNFEKIANILNNNDICIAPWKDTIRGLLFFVLCVLFLFFNYGFKSDNLGDCELPSDAPLPSLP